MLASCYGASGADVQLLGAEPGERTAKLFGPVSYVEPRASLPAAEVGGVNVHVGAAFDGRDRRRLERVCRYMARPPVCQERITRLGDSIRYEFKKAWRNGTKAVLLSPLDFIARLCALVPQPRFHTLRYHGALAGGSAVRQDIVPGRPGQPKTQIQLIDAPGVDLPPASLPTRHPWAQLLKRVFQADVSRCPVLGRKGDMKIVDIATTVDHVASVLAQPG